MKKIVGGSFLMTAIALTIACEQGPQIEGIQAEATPTPKARIVSVGGDETYYYTTNVRVFCDEETGNLIYTMAGPDRGGIAVVEGGCMESNELEVVR